MNLKRLNDETLISLTKESVDIEILATSKVIECFQEIYDRKLYLKRGYSSLFEMVTKVFGYCPGSAQLRINAMRLIQEVPIVREKIDSGEMSLTVAAQVQSFLYREKKANRPYSQNAMLELVETCSEKSVSEVQREFVRRNPEIEKRDVIRLTSEDRVRVSHSSSTRLEEKLNRIKHLWSHIDPDMSREDLLEKMADLVLEKIDPVQKAERASSRRAKKQESIKNRSESVAYDSLHLSETRVQELKLTTEDSGDESHNESKDESKDKSVDAVKTAKGWSSHHSVERPSFHLSEMKVRTRYVKAAVKRAVWVKNGNSGCEYVDEISGSRCGSRFQLEIDHIHPFSEGGSNELENLRVLCGSHNRLRWEERSS